MCLLVALCAALCVYAWCVCVWLCVVVGWLCVCGLLCVCLLVALCVSVWLLVCVLSGSRVQLVGWLSVWLCGGAGAALAQNCWWPHVAAPRP